MKREFAHPALSGRRKSSSARPARWQRLKHFLGRETVGAWLGPVVLAVLLAALHLAGAFSLIDGRLFDAATTRGRGQAPRVVLVELGPTQHLEPDTLERRLGELGVVRIGHLAPPAASPVSPARGGPQVIHALSVRPVPASANWSLAGAAPPGAQAAARIVPISDYGIFRGQRRSVAGSSEPLASFESMMAGRGAQEGEFLVRMERNQSIPSFSADHLLGGQLQRGDLAGLVAVTAPAELLVPRYTTPLTPAGQGMSEARLRAFAIQNLIAGREVQRAPSWEAGLLLLIAVLVPALAYSRVDPKRFALPLALGQTLLVLVAGWATLEFANRLLPLTALMLAPWLVTFHRVLLREASQDRRLEHAASRAMQHSFRRSALREGARLPEYLGTAARIAGVEKSLLVAQLPDGKVELVLAQGADMGDLDPEAGQLALAFDRLRGSSLSIAARQLVPGWGRAARMTWLGRAHGDLFWIHALPQTTFLRKSQRLVRAMTSSFRELFRWRADLNARSRNDERFVPIDDRVASAIALISRESEQVRHGIDALDTAVVIFHLIGSPLHANARMHEIFRLAGLVLEETDLPLALTELTDLDGQRIDAMLQDLLLNGGEMRVPMREVGSGERMIRLAAPDRLGKREGRVLVLEAIDVANLNRAADLRQAIALYIDAQLRNDLEAIMIGADLALNPKITCEQLKPVIARIADTARRGTSRLDEVTGLTRASNSQTIDACYPLDARKLALEARAKVADFAADLSVGITVDTPGIGGFTIAEPQALGEMLCAMLRVVLSDTPRGDKVKLKVEELETRTRIRISGGFGIGFQRLVELLSGNPDEAVGDYKHIADGMAKALQWDASVSYWGREADGFGFTVDLRRIG